MVHDNKTGKSKVQIGLPIEYRDKGILGTINHEIGTHYLRKYNERFQVWYKKKEKYEVRPCIKTEEGLASINQLIVLVNDNDCVPFLYTAALNYYQAYLASKMSFVEVFNEISDIIDNPKRRFKRVARVKRGLTDTGELGGLYKDQVYLEGAIEILANRKNIDFHGLLCGKISLDDLKRPVIERRLKKENCVYPLFMQDMEDYMKKLDELARINHVP